MLISKDNSNVQEGKKMRFYIVYTQHGIVISKHGQIPESTLLKSLPGCWGFLGPWSMAHAADYLASAFPDLCPSAEEQLANLKASRSLCEFARFAIMRAAPSGA